MIYNIRHVTSYRYGSPVSQCYNQAYLLPRDTDFQRCLDSRIRISPFPSMGSERRDYFGNRAYHFSVEQQHSELEVEVESRVDVDVQFSNRSLDLDFGSTCGEARQLLLNDTKEQSLLAREFVLDSSMIKASEELRDYAAPLFGDKVPLLSAVRELTSQIYSDFSYDPGFTTVATALDEVVEHRRGVCQDFAHLAIACLRSQGFAARYISGYIETQPALGEEKLVGADASHAWFAVYSPGEGWFEFDPTNDNIPNEQHIVTAWGRDYTDVTPLRGVIFDGGETQVLSVSVDVSRQE